MSLKIDKSSWSKPFALDAVGTNGIVKCELKGGIGDYKESFITLFQFLILILFSNFT